MFRCYSLYDYEFTPGPTSPDVCSGATLCMTMSSLLDLFHLMFVHMLSLYDYEFNPELTSPDVCSGAILFMTMISFMDLLYLMFVHVLLSV